MVGGVAFLVLLVVFLFQEFLLRVIRRMITSSFIRIDTLVASRIIELA